MFQYFCLDDWIPVDHLLRAIDRHVDFRTLSALAGREPGERNRLRCTPRASTLKASKDEATTTACALRTSVESISISRRVLANARYTGVEGENATGDCKAFGRGHWVDGDALNKVLGQGLGVGVGSGGVVGMPPLLPHATPANASIATNVAAITPRRTFRQLSG